MTDHIRSFRPVDPSVLEALRFPAPVVGPHLYAEIFIPVTAGVVIARLPAKGPNAVMANAYFIPRALDDEGRVEFQRGSDLVQLAEALITAAQAFDRAGMGETGVSEMLARVIGGSQPREDPRG